MTKPIEIEFSYQPYIHYDLGYDPFKRMTRREAKNYFSWFVEQIPIQISQLEVEVRTTNEDYQSWSADKSVESLEILGLWLQSQSQMRKRTEEDIERVYARLTPKDRSMVGAVDTVPAEKTILAAVKTGIYLGEVFRENLKGTSWTLVIKPKSDINYHQPVLGGFEPAYTCNAVMVARFLAIGLAEGKSKPEELREMYDYWIPHVLNTDNQ